MAQSGKNSQAQDVMFPDEPSDGVSFLACNGSQTAPTNIVIAGSWDNSLSCYEIQYQGTMPSGIKKHAALMHDAPVLCGALSQDNTTFSGGCDGQVRMWNPAHPTTTATILGRHDQPIRNLCFIPEMGVVVTGSWDKTVRIWDPRVNNGMAVFTAPVSERVYAMDCKGENLVVGTADKSLHVFNLRTQQKAAEFKSQLAYQTRCISIFSDNQGFAMGCIEGRVAIEYFDEMHLKNRPKGSVPNPKSFVFKCHRDGNDIFAVNAIDFHPYNTFCTGGSDGVFSWWDKDARHRLAQFDLHKRKVPITAVKFSPRGDVMFYALSYDWSKGAEHNVAGAGHKIVYHPVLDAEIQPKRNNMSQTRR